MTMLEIRTDRLLLRRWRPEDVEPFADMCADEEVMRHIGPGVPMTAAQVKADIANYEHCWREYGFGQFAVERIDDGKFIGFAGLAHHTLFPEYQSCIEIGWRFSREAWGNGYATEAAKAVLEFAADHLKIDNIVSVCQSGNIASERIMQKIGLTFSADGVAPNNGRAVKIYTLPDG